MSNSYLKVDKFDPRAAKKHDHLRPYDKLDRFIASLKWQD
jgi:hypothetical protein